MRKPWNAIILLSYQSSIKRNCKVVGNEFIGEREWLQSGGARGIVKAWPPLFIHGVKIAYINDGEYMVDADKHMALLVSLSAAVIKFSTLFHRHQFIHSDRNIGKSTSVFRQSAYFTDKALLQNHKRPYCPSLRMRIFSSALIEIIIAALMAWTELDSHLSSEAEFSRYLKTVSVDILFTRSKRADLRLFRSIAALGESLCFIMLDDYFESEEELTRGPAMRHCREDGDTDLAFIVLGTGLEPSI